MADTEDRALIIDEGGLPGLLACMVAPTPRAALAWFPASESPASNRRLDMVRRHTAFLELADVISDPAESGHGSSTTLLLAAGRAALRLDCSRLIWPVFVGDDTEAIAREHERARLIAGLLRLDADRGALAVDTPFLDLDDRHLADLAVDMDAPAGLWWPCEGESEAPCGECEQCQRWAEAFEPAAQRSAAAGAVSTMSVRT